MSRAGHHGTSPRSGTTLAVVAERVGVSPRTVSRVVNDEGGFSDETRKRVLAAIQEVGYRPNLRARSLVTNTTDNVALMVTDITDPYFPDLAESVGASLAKAGRTMTLALNNDDLGEQQRLVDSMLSLGVDGIVAAPARSDIRALKEAADLGVPVVLFDCEVDHRLMGSVSNDISGGTATAVTHLIDRGHERIGMLCHNSIAGGRSSRRLEAFRTTMADAGLDPSRVALGEPNLGGGRAATLELLDRYADTTAVFAYNDLMAVGLMQAAATLGRSIPDDIATVGFDDIDIASVTTPQLTTIRLDRDQLGRIAAEILDQMISEPSIAPTPQVVPTELVVRGST